MKYPIREIGLKHIDWIGLILTTKLPKEAKLLAMYLSRFMNKDQHVAWPSYSRMQNECSLARSTVDKYLRLLESEGWIKRERGNSTTNTRYYIAFPEIVERGIQKLGSTSDELPSTSGELRSTRDELGVVRVANSNSQLNNPTNNTFAQFYESYPRKVAKADAEKAWKKLSEKERELAIADVRKRVWSKDRKFIPYPASYLNGQRWLDEERQQQAMNTYGVGAI